MTSKKSQRTMTPATTPNDRMSQMGLNAAQENATNVVMDVASMADAARL